MRSLNNLRNALCSDFKLCSHERIDILHFIESKHKFQNVSKNFFHPLFRKKITFLSHFWHNFGAVASITQSTNVLLIRYTAGSTLKHKGNARFHGTVSFDPDKMLQKIKRKYLSNVWHTKNCNYLVLSSDLEELLNLIFTQLFLLSSGS